MAGCCSVPFFRELSFGAWPKDVLVAGGWDRHYHSRHCYCFGSRNLPFPGRLHRVDAWKEPPRTTAGSDVAAVADPFGNPWWSPVRSGNPEGLISPVRFGIRGWWLSMLVG